MATTFMDIPELSSLLATYLSTASLAACVQVNHQWNATFIPVLWHTIDDHHPGWNEIMGTCSHPSSKGQKDETWVRAVFSKYGHHIRDLTIHWHWMVTVASEEPSCCRLKSLWLCTGRQWTLLQQESAAGQPFSFILPPVDGSEVDILDQPPKLLDPQLANVFQSRLVRGSPFQQGRTSRLEQEEDWMWTQQFWLLVLKNSLTLKRFDYNPRASFRLLPFALPFYFRDTILKGMPELRELKLQNKPVGLWELLDHVPYIKTLEIDVSQQGEDQPFPAAGVSCSMSVQLRDLALLNHVALPMVLAVLRMIPCLERLSIAGFAEIRGSMDAWITPTQAQAPHKYLQELTILKTQDGYRPKDILLATLIPLLPCLIRLGTMDFGPESARALVTHCPRFQHFVMPRGNLELRYNQWIADDAGWKGNLGIDLLLRTCPTLRTLDAVEYYVHVEDLLFNTPNIPWACQGTLEHLGIKVMGITRTTAGDDGQDEDVFDMEKEHSQRRELQQHHKVYTQLSQLTNLTRLNLGYDARDGCHDGKIEVLDLQGTHSHIAYELWQASTLRLSLRSGLGILQSLAKLEVFGFEGVDHQICEPELTWMSVHWPRLRVVYGLTGDEKTEGLVDEDKKRLKEFMMVMCPRVKHQDSIMETAALTTPMAPR